MLDTLLRNARVIPVVTLDRVEDAVPLARTLREAGIPLVEITLRSPAALPAIRAIRAADVDIDVALGSVRSAADFDAALAVGARLCISPGATPTLIAAARALGIAWLPGASSPSEAMALAEAGFTIQKLFPASLPLLHALRGPLGELSFVPTGGIEADNLGDYLVQPNVLAVAGSWIASPDLVSARAWTEIGSRAAAARAMATRS
jgi:2-dehydro-3-deoxyphosphogluconate aldolase / (4S)-4-hydroxy-2-oxoglutarate aldolase